MMGPKQEAQAALFYKFSPEDHVPQDHLLRSTDRFVDLSGVRAHVGDFYSHTGTGGPETARDVVRNLAENFAVTTLELGGKSPILVFEDADLDGAANGLIAGNFDGSHRAIKLVMRWTSVSERTAKNWLAGSHGPAGEHLVELMRNSNEVLAAVLSLVGRGELKIGAGLHETREALVQVLEVLDGLLGTSEAGAGENE